MKFKVGDKFRDEVGRTTTITSISSDGGYGRYPYNTDNWGHCSEDYLESKQLITPMTRLTEAFSLAFKSEPEKSFRKAGITNGDDLLTDEGQKVFLGFLLEMHKAEFKTKVVDEILKELDDKK